jgi:hypothetical protein
VQREIDMDQGDLWIVEHFSELVTKYAGKYLAVVNETLVAVGDSGKEVETKAREVEPNKMPSVLRVRAKRIYCVCCRRLSSWPKIRYSAERK